jgi:hypothetical protein
MPLKTGVIVTRRTSRNEKIDGDAVSGREALNSNSPHRLIEADAWIISHDVCIDNQDRPRRNQAYALSSGVTEPVTYIPVASG